MDSVMDRGAGPGPRTAAGVPAIDRDGVVRAFPEGVVRRLTGLSERQLQYWDDRDLVRPSLAAGQGRGHRRLYDFRDLVSLRVAADLRQHGVSLQTIRKVVGHLRSLDYHHPLAEVQCWSWGGELYFEEAATIRAGRRPEQVLASFAVPVPAIVDRLQADIAQLDARTPGQTEQRRATLGHQLVFAGTRIPVAAVRRLLRAGATAEEILALYPDLALADLAVAAAEAPRPGRRAS
ncbi:MAG TPA: DUF433 domain-containing protein [Candidatus Dormibacteraeota bacterium]|nr:DUF433 domain-containing protein [Candidatus Dormibacteraeota bacterium]